MARVEVKELHLTSTLLQTTVHLSLSSSDSRLSMRILITVTAQDHFLRTAVSVMDTGAEVEDCQVLHGLQHRPPTPKDEQIETPAKLVTVSERSFVRSVGKTPIESYSFRQWLTPNAIHIIVQLLSVVAFCALFFPYLRYTRAKKAVMHEVCKQDARILYESKLALCDARAATTFSFRGGALGLNWMEFGTILCAAVAWHYVIWLVQGWLIVRVCFVKNEGEK